MTLASVREHPQCGEYILLPVEEWARILAFLTRNVHPGKLGMSFRD